MINLIGSNLLTLGLAFLFAFSVSPSYLDKDGTLIEAFGLLPLGWASAIIGAGLLIFSAVRAARNRSKPY